MKGVNPEWANLPRRKCDDCGKGYKPKQPLRPNTRGFCSDNCRKSYHKHGGAYRKLRVEVAKMVKREFEAIHGELKELRRLWIETEARYVELAGQVQEQQHTARAVAGEASPHRAKRDASQPRK